jgi:hypothetical protein
MTFQQKSLKMVNLQQSDDFRQSGSQASSRVKPWAVLYDNDEFPLTQADVDRRLQRLVRSFVGRNDL